MYESFEHRSSSESFDPTLKQLINSEVRRLRDPEVLREATELTTRVEDLLRELTDVYADFGPIQSWPDRRLAGDLPPDIIEMIDSSYDHLLTRIRQLRGEIEDIVRRLEQANLRTLPKEIRKSLSALETLMPEPPNS